MTLDHKQVTVGTTAVAIPAAATARNRQDRTLILQNNSAVAIYLGGPSVTTTNYGYKLAAAASLEVTLGANDILFGIIAVSTAVLNVTIVRN